MHVNYVSKHGATNIDIFKTDTDILMLALRRFPQLCKDTKLIARNMITAGNWIKINTEKWWQPYHRHQILS